MTEDIFQRDRHIEVDTLDHVSFFQARDESLMVNKFMGGFNSMPQGERIAHILKGGHQLLVISDIQNNSSWRPVLSDQKLFWFN